MSCLTCSNCGFTNSLSPDSQIQKLQSSDDVLSQILRGSRPLLESDHAPIIDDITKLEQLESWYSVQLHAVQTYLQKRKSVYAPIRRLWVLSSVCGSWRGILHTSPASWARYVLVVSPFPKHALEILQTYLDRTGEHPLSLVVLCYSRDVTEDGEIMSLLVQSSHRWRNLCIHTHEDHMHHLESVSQFPVLETIEIEVIDYMVDFLEISSDMCLNAPQLCQVTLPNQGIDQFRLPSGITHYSCAFASAADLQLLSQLPNLRTCHLASCETLGGAVPVVMAELRQLYVDDSKTLDFITAPLLETLTFAWAPQDSSSPGIAPFLSRSGCHLKSLSMPTQTSSPWIRDLFSLEACSTISYLKLHLRTNWRCIFESLAPSSVLPNLHHLSLSFVLGDYTYAKEKPLLLEMVRFRCKEGQLKIVETSSHRHTSDFNDITAEIRTVIGDNVEMRVGKWNLLHQDYKYSFSGPSMVPY